MCATDTVIIEVGEARNARIDDLRRRNEKTDALGSAETHAAGIV
jgi:hypothetical protein